MVNCSSHSIFVQKKKLPDEEKEDNVWYKDLIDLVLGESESVRDEDATIAIETTMHVVDYHIEQCQDRSIMTDNQQENESHEIQNNDNKGPMLTTLESFFRGKKAKAANKKEETHDQDGDINNTNNPTLNKERSSDEEARQGLFGAESATDGWLLDKFLKASGTSKRYKKMVALIAWSLALIGLIVSLAFLTRDFRTSRNETASTVKYESSETLDLPKLWFCTADTQLPAFNEMPSTFQGKPLFWVDFLKGTSAELNVTFPDTRALSQFRTTTIGPIGQPCNASKAMDPTQFYSESTAKPPCFHCLSMIRNPALRIDRETSSQSSFNDFSSHAAIRISHQAYISRCRTAQFGLPTNLFQFFTLQMKEHHANLTAKGTLDFAEYDPMNKSHDQFLWPAYRGGFNNNSEDFRVFDVVDMFCNVYLFSGYFYPSTSKDVRYSFDGRLKKWQRNGEGPYYPAQFSDYQAATEGEEAFEHNETIGQEKYDHLSTFVGNSLYIMTNASRLGNAETLAVLSPSEIASISFSRNEIMGQESFQTEVLRSFLEYRDVRAASFVYFIDFRFSSFFTRVIAKQQAMSWTAFLADFFGLTSLFLDISVYTLIVAPISGRTSHLFSRKKTASDVK